MIEENCTHFERQIEILTDKLIALETEEQSILSEKMEVPQELSQRQKILFQTIVQYIDTRQKRLRNIRDDIKTTEYAIIKARMLKETEKTAIKIAHQVEQTTNNLLERTEAIEKDVDKLKNPQLPNKKWWYEFLFIVFTNSGVGLTLMFLVWSNFDLNYVANYSLKAYAFVSLIFCSIKVTMDVLIMFPSCKKFIENRYGYNQPPQQKTEKVNQGQPQTSQQIVAHNVSDQIQAQGPPSN